MSDRDTSVFGPSMVMMLLSVLLFWLPGLGTLIAGFVGGRMAGGVGAALFAALLPSLLLGVGLFFLGAMLTGIPVVGVVFAMLGSMLALAQAGTLLLGAFIGGLFA